MNLLRLVFVVATLSVCMSAMATPEILKKFKEVYGKPEANCKVCHTKPPERNAYGIMVAEALASSGGIENAKAAFQSIEQNDADNDGVKNGDEIAADTLPGDPSSKPASEGKPQAGSTSSELVPKHSFHPAIVHFPIALLAVAALLELFSKRKSDPIYHKASVINLSIGLAGAVGAIITGVLAWLRLGFTLEGNLLIHLIVASLSVLVGVGALVQREKPSYLWLIIVSGALVLIAGHFGGTMIYG